jgi:hypothetical protein
MGTGSKFVGLTAQCRNQIKVEIYVGKPVHQFQLLLVYSFPHAGFRIVESDPHEQGAIDPFSQDMANLRNSAEILAKRSFQAVSDQYIRHFGVSTLSCILRERFGSPISYRTTPRESPGCVHSFIQSEKSGTSLAQALKVYADALRTRRRLRAEAAVGKAGIKMLFPIVIFIVPVLFVITLAPGMLSVLRDLKMLGGGR